MRPLEVDEPTVVGPYRLLGRLGSGGMGRVYLGRSAGGRTVAVKIVHPHFALDEEFRARFRREVDAARRVGGAWTAPVLDADPDARIPWVATAYAAGPSLAAAVTDTGPLPGPTVRALGAGLAEALAAVHELGLVHRDVKPSNVLLTLDGPLLIDFGIARATDGTASLTSTGVSVGSPGYMSPEQILGKGVTGAADVFSLGAVLAYAATGRPPFPGDSSAALLYKVVHEPPELDDLDGEVRELAEACLDKDPAARPSPAEVSRRLAPEGAARAVAGGWLPGALVEQVSRAAVQLLNLETGAGAGSGPGPGSGPVDFSSPSVGEAPTSGPATGGFGPPPVMPERAGRPAGAERAEPEAAGAAAVPGPPGAGRPAPGAPHPPTQPAARRPGKLTVSATAASAAEHGGRGRRVSCTVALAVAGALAAATVGSVFVFDLLPGGSSGGPSGSDGGARSEAPAAAVGQRRRTSAPGRARPPPADEQVAIPREARSAMTIKLAPSRIIVCSSSVSEPWSISPSVGTQPSQRSSSTTMCGSRSSSATAARCSPMSAKPLSANRSWRRDSSPLSRLTSRITRSVWLRPTTAPQCGSRVSAFRAPLPQSMPYRCTSATEWVRASDPAMVRSTWERPLRGAPPIIRWPKVAKSTTTGRRAWSAGRSSTPYGAGGSLPGASATAGTSTSSSSSVSSSAGSHGLCWAGMPSESLASRTASTSTFRSVISSSSRTWDFGLASAARPRSSQASGPTQGASAAGSAAPGRRPPTPTRLERHQGGVAEPGVGATRGALRDVPGLGGVDDVRRLAGVRHARRDARGRRRRRHDPRRWPPPVLAGRRRGCRESSAARACRSRGGRLVVERPVPSSDQ
ncbi:Serine/threonine-protein kinase PknD [Streptomyces griseomycini]